MTSDLIYSFPPIVDEYSRILILGTAPGNSSLDKGEYYVHPSNEIWKLIAFFCDQPVPKTYPEKNLLLKEAQIALWDICYSCDRKKSSLDSAIKNIIPNDIPAFLRKYPNIKVLAFNGRPTQMIYDRYFKRYKDITYISLYSSSSANIYSFEAKLETWHELINHMDEKFRYPPDRQAIQ
jgi:TDG/mug DNA glycosylase family protein